MSDDTDSHEVAWQALETFLRCSHMPVRTVLMESAQKEGEYAPHPIQLVVSTLDWPQSAEAHCLQDCIAALEAENARLREALEWYEKQASLAPPHTP